MVKWNLSELHKKEETEKILKQITELVEKAKSFRNELNENIKPERFIEMIKYFEKISSISSKLSGFSSLWLTEKTDSSERNTYYAQLSQKLTELGNELIFFGLWFKALPDKKADELIKKSGKYSYHLSSIRRFKDHSLSEKEEKIINIKDLTGDEASTRFYDIITNSFKFELDGKELTQSDLVPLVRSPDEKLRKEVYEKLLSKYKDNQHILGEIYKVLVQDWRNENILLRKFKTPIGIRNLGNDVKDKTVENLLNVIQKNINIFHEYFEIKAKILGYNKLNRYHLYAPINDLDKEYSYEKSKDIVLSTYKEFSEQAYNYANEIFEKNHVHSDIQKGKQSGAFCSTPTNEFPPYILLNFKNKLMDVFTMMHEFGHGIHGRAAKDQTQFTYHSALPMAETASIFGETLLEKKMLKKSSDEEKKQILIKSLDDKYASIIRQAYFVIFEIKAHELINKGATIEQLNKLYFQTLKDQFNDAVELPEIFQHEWKYIPHIYHTPFYCYAYAFGNLMALSLYKTYEQQGKEFVDKYMSLLSAGGSDSPFNLVKDNLGLDITQEDFWQKAFDLIQEEVEELKKLI
jgi:oligoendopeptidase F